jgi:hypothetical protein
MIKRFNDPIRARARKDIARQESSRLKFSNPKKLTKLEMVEIEKKFGARFVEEISSYHMRKMRIAKPEYSKTVSRAIREFIFSETKDKNRFISRITPYVGSREKAIELLLAVAEDFMAVSRESGNQNTKKLNTK